MAKNNNRDVSGLVFTACLFLGLGIGALLGQTGAGVLIGLGVGFAAMAITRVVQR